MSKTINKNNDATNTNKAIKAVEVVETVETVENNSTNVQNTDSSDLKNLLSVIEDLKKQVEDLKAQKSAPEITGADSSAVVDTEVTSTSLLQALLNRKSDKEVVIVHNAETAGGLSDILSLNGAVIKFHKLGEQRVLTWQQFEECVSKYRKLFDNETILLGEGQEDLAEKYSISSVNRGYKYILTKEKISSLGTMSIKELEEFFSGLGEYDKKTVLTYWLGRCYEKDLNFFDRYKMELLNRLSNTNTFDNVIVELNTFKK